MKDYTENKYYFLFNRLIVLMVILLLLDFSIGNTMRYFYFNQKSGKHYRTTYTMEEVKTGIIVLGSSRANHHYHPEVFENVLGDSFYNAGRDGNFIFYHYAVLKSALKRYTPDIVILDILRDEFSKNQFSYDGLSSLLPYYRDHPEIRPIVELRSPYEKVKLISSIYPYNSAIFSIIAGNLGLRSEKGKEKKGYVPITKIYDGTVPETFPVSEGEIDPHKIAVFDSLTEECITAGVSLFIICSPYYSTVEDTETLEIARNIAQKYDIPFFDFSSEPTFIGRPELFADADHLNDEGAKIFSSIVAGKIREELLLRYDRKKYMSHEGSVADE